MASANGSDAISGLDVDHGDGRLLRGLVEAAHRRLAAELRDGAPAVIRIEQGVQQPSGMLRRAPRWTGSVRAALRLRAPHGVIASPTTAFAGCIGPTGKPPRRVSTSRAHTNFDCGSRQSPQRHTGIPARSA